MTFYRSLTPYYDEIFPTNLKALDFLGSNFKQGGLLLDVGAGTGNMALCLSKRGYKVTAMEPEEAMAIQIREKADGNSISVFTKTMQQIDEFAEKFDGIYCVGNTLVHLNNLEEINEFLHNVYRRLNDNGVFICQIVNFERVLEKRDFTFPIIQKETFEFKRRYDLAGEKILFTTEITSEDQTFTNTTSLYPATSKQLLPILKNCGFQSIETYGDFKKGAYSANSPALIITAKK